MAAIRPGAAPTTRASACPILGTGPGLKAGDSRPAGAALPISARPSPSISGWRAGRHGASFYPAIAAMPELPEVETVRRGLQPVLEGARIVASRRGGRICAFPFPERFAETLDRPARHRARPARQIPDRASRRRRRADLPSRHVRLVPDRRRRRRRRRPACSITSARSSTAHDHVVFTVESPAGRPARIIFNDPRRFGFMLLSREAVLDQHPMLAGLGVEPTGNALERRTDRRPVPRPRDAAEIGAARPAADRRHRQHLCVRGAVAGEAVAAARRGLDRQPGPAKPRRGPIASPRRCDRSSPRRSRPAARRCATISRPTARSAISSTASRSTIARASPARAATAAASSRASCRPAARPSIARSASDELERCRDRLDERMRRMAYETIIAEDARQGRADHAQPAEGAQRAQLAGAVRTGRGARRASTPIPASAPS